MAVTRRAKVLIPAAILLFLLGAFCLLQAESLAWQATSGETADGAAYAAGRNTVARLYFVAACVAIVGAGIAVVFVVRRGRAIPFAVVALAIFAILASSATTAESDAFYPRGPLLMAFVPSFIFLALVIGAAELWTKTKRAAVLLQLIGCSLTFILLILERLANYLARFDKRALFNAIHFDFRGFTTGLVFLALLAFTIGYLWYAFSEKRI